MPKTRKEKKKQRILNRKLENTEKSTLESMKKKSQKESKMEIENLAPPQEKNENKKSAITNDRLKSYGMMNAPK